MSAFTHDAGDPSVGIFGEAWYHSCGTETAALEEPAGEVNRPHGETDFYTILTCPDCVAQRVIIVRDFTGWNEPADYRLDQTWDGPRDATGIDCHEAYEGIDA